MKILLALHLLWLLHLSGLSQSASGSAEATSTININEKKSATQLKKHVIGVFYSGAVGYYLYNNFRWEGQEEDSSPMYTFLTGIKYEVRPVPWFSFETGFHFGNFGQNDKRRIRLSRAQRDSLPRPLPDTLDARVQERYFSFPMKWKFYPYRDKFRLGIGVGYTADIVGNGKIDGQVIFRDGSIAPINTTFNRRDDESRGVFFFGFTGEITFEYPRNRNWYFNTDLAFRLPTAIVLNTDENLSNRPWNLGINIGFNYTIGKGLTR